MAFFGKMTFIIKGNNESAKTVAGIFGIPDGTIDANNAENYCGRLIIKLYRLYGELGVKIPEASRRKRAVATAPNDDLLCSSEKWLDYVQNEYAELTKAKNDVKSKVDAESFFAYMKKSETDFGFFTSPNFASFAGSLTTRNYRRFCKKIFDISEITIVKLKKKKNRVYLVCLSTSAKKETAEKMLDSLCFRKIDEKTLFLLDRTERELVKSFKESKRTLALLKKREKQTVKEYSRKLNKLFSELVPLYCDVPAFYSEGDSFTLAVKTRASETKDLRRLLKTVRNIEFELV